jgi:hypothetical protein
MLYKFCYELLPLPYKNLNDKKKTLSPGKHFYRNVVETKFLPICIANMKRNIWFNYGKCIYSKNGQALTNSL